MHRPLSSARVRARRNTLVRMIGTQDITGLILAGGRGSRMGGVDKGLQPHGGVPLARHALNRLAPQVGRLMLSANRHLDAYAAMGVPVWPDTLPDHSGPLAGFIAGLAHCETPYLATVPCDAPRFSEVLVARLAVALDAAAADLAVAVTLDGDVRRPQPVFCLMKRTLLDDLARFVAAGGRRAADWAARQRFVEVVFDDAPAFANANTLAELALLEPRRG